MSSKHLLLLSSVFLIFCIINCEGKTHIPVSKLPHGKAVVCYVGTWSVYRPGKGSFFVNDINHNLCSHLVYAFVGIDNKTNTLRSIDNYNDLEENHGKEETYEDYLYDEFEWAWEKFQHIEQFIASKFFKNFKLRITPSRKTMQNALKRKLPRRRFWITYSEESAFRLMTLLKNSNPNLKVTLAVGGWTEGSKNYSIMAASPSARQNFIQSVMRYMESFDFDGLDLDWEFPAARGGNPEDKQNFVLLIKELKAALKKRNRILTAAISAAPDIIDAAYDVAEISKYLDLIHVMAYDYHGSWDKEVGPNAPISSDDNLNVEHSIKYLLERGAAPEKLIIGIPAYGRTFITADKAEMHAPTITDNFQGPFTRENGFMGYNEICWELMKNSSSWQVLWDENSSTPLAINGNRVISYDNERSVAEKVHTALKYGVGGFMMWSIDTDDFRGDCDINRDPEALILGADPHAYPLLRTIHRSIEVYKDLPSPIEVPLLQQTTMTTANNADTTEAPKSGAPTVANYQPIILLAFLFLAR